MVNYTKVATLENEFEAQIIKSILEEREIPHYVKSFYDVAYDGLYQKSQGWGVIFAPIEYMNEIAEIVEDVRK